MKVVIDVAPADYAFARERVRGGDYVVVVTGDPSAMPPRIEGIAWVRKDLGPKHDIIAYNLHGSQFTVAQVTVQALLFDLGLEQAETVRFSADATEILAKWPGPVARRILLTWGTTKSSAIAHMRQWYRVTDDGLTLAEQEI